MLQEWSRYFSKRSQRNDLSRVGHAFARAIVESQDNLVTKDILEIALSPIKTDLAILKADSVTLKWMMGVLIAGVMSIVIKTFF